MEDTNDETISDQTSPFVLWIFLLMVVVPVAIDPYNVFHVENIRDNGIEPIKTS